MAMNDYGEVPERTESISYNYWVGQYPVTQALYTINLWKLADIQKKITGQMLAGKIKRKVTLGQVPEKYDDTFMLANHPVVGISWYEASAFIQWLNEYALRESHFFPLGMKWPYPGSWSGRKQSRGGHQVPEQAEISHLNQGLNPVELKLKVNAEPGRAYTYGKEANANKMNCFETGIGRTTSPGCYVDAENPHGAVDMNGNVWEWCTDIWSKEPPDSSGLEERPVE